MKRELKVGVAVVAAAGLFAVGGMSTAVAAKLITSSQIKDGTIQRVDLSDGINSKLDKKGEDGKDGAQGPAGPAGETGPAGPAGPKGDPGAQGPVGNTGPAGSNGTDGLTGAVYRVANYTSGGTSSATVACADTDADSMNYTAIAGGVQGSVSNSNANGTENANSFAVTSSFPGRMDWAGADGIRDTGDAGEGLPKPGRLDGWVVLSNGKATSTLRVWALCVPTNSIPVETTNY